jgi:hypothetical protein
MTDAEFINERLIQLYGKEPISNQPKYRIVRSEEQTEKRYGKYNLLTQETGIWLGVKEGLVEIKKYWYLTPCWLLERVEPNLNRQDTIYDKWVYEPLFPFLDKDDRPLPLNWRAIEVIIGSLERVERKMLTEEDHRKEEEKVLDKEAEDIYSELDKPESTKPLPTFNTSTLLGD